jgi:hypothetical protein
MASTATGHKRVVGAMRLTASHGGDEEEKNADDKGDDKKNRKNGAKKDVEKNDNKKTWDRLWDAPKLG